MHESRHLVSSVTSILKNLALGCGASCCGEGGDQHPFIFPCGLEAGLPAYGEFQQMSSESLWIHRAEHSLCCETGGALISLGLSCLQRRWEMELGLAIGRQPQIRPVEWFCLVLGILSSLLHFCDVQSVEEHLVFLTVPYTGGDPPPSNNCF